MFLKTTTGVYWANHLKLVLLEIAVWKYHEVMQGLQSYTEYRSNLLIKSLHMRAIYESSQSEVFLKIGVPKSKQNS